MVLDEPPEAQRLQLLNDVWKVVMKLSLPEVQCNENISAANIFVVLIFLLGRNISID